MAEPYLDLAENGLLPASKLIGALHFMQCKGQCVACLMPLSVYCLMYIGFYIVVCFKMSSDHACTSHCLKAHS
jgi:hypothetical protein